MFIKNIIMEDPCTLPLFAERFEQLKSFIEKHGTMPSEKVKDADEHGIARYFMNIKKDKRDNRLHEYYEKSLDTLKPVWQWTKIDKFHQQVNDVKQWVTQHGKLPVRSNKTDTEYKLGKFCENNRDMYNSKKLTDPEKIKTLESIPHWFWKRPEFDDRIDELKLFVEKNNRFPKSSGSERRLAYWITCQREARNDLSSDQIAKLESIDGWKWNVLDGDFIEKYDSLKLWLNENNSKYPRPTSKDPNEKRLGNFVRGIKSKHETYVKKFADRVTLLESLPNWKW